MESADDGKRFSPPSSSSLSTSSDFLHAAAADAKSTNGQKKRNEEDNNVIRTLDPGLNQTFPGVQPVDGRSNNNDMRSSPPATTTLGEVDIQGKGLLGPSQLNDLRTDVVGEANVSTTGQSFSHSLSDCSETTDFGLSINIMSQEGSTGHKKLVDSPVGLDYTDKDFLIGSMPKNEQPSHGLEASVVFQPAVEGRSGELNLSNNSSATQSPPTQVMERPGDPTTPSYRIPDYVFARNKSTAPLEWSTASNESLFSIQMGNMSFTGDQFPWLGKSGELGLPGEVNMSTPTTMSTPPNAPNIDFSSNQPPAKQSAEIPRKSGNSEEEPSPRVTEAKAAETMREVIRENAENHEKANAPVTGEGKYHSACLSHASDGSTRSFAFPTLAGDGGTSCSLRGYGTKQKQQPPQKPMSQREYSRPQTQSKETPNASSQTSKSTPNMPDCRWGLSCFSCCPSCC